MNNQLKRFYFSFVGLFWLISICFSTIDASNILFFHTGATASHRTAIWPLAEKLADAGHRVSYVFPISKRPGSHPKIEELKPSKMFAAVEHFVGEFDINIRLNNTVDKWLADAFLKIPQFCEAFYESPEIIEWLSRPGLHYDLIMIDGGLGQCAYGLVHKFKAKHILFNGNTLPFLWESFGIVPETSSIPEFMFHQKPESLMNSLWSRTVNTLSMWIWKTSAMGTYREFEAIVKKHLNLTEAPNFEAIEKNTSLVLHNTYFIEDYPMSLPPMFVSFSGLLCREKDYQNTNPLPEKLKSFIDDKDSDGFVYVSFGSSVSMSGMPDILKKQFIDAFAAFPKLRFLWRWTGPIPLNLPSNVHMQPWFPQRDILAHPKVKAFITQAGRPSSQEALCYGVPMISFPIFGDQDMNADRLESIGISISLDINTVTSSKLINAIQNITETEKYKTRMTELSAMFRDRPMDPLENVFYWVEYVLKYDTSLLRPLSIHLTWWQRRLLDVYLLVFIVTALIVGVILFLCVLFIKCALRYLKCLEPAKTKPKSE